MASEEGETTPVSTADESTSGTEVTSTVVESSGKDEGGESVVVEVQGGSSSQEGAAPKVEAGEAAGVEDEEGDVLPWERKGEEGEESAAPLDIEAYIKEILDAEVGISEELKRELNALNERLAKDMYDTSAWPAVLKLGERSGNLAFRRQCYERFLKIFPASSSYWKQYAEMEVKHKHFDKAHVLFSRCLYKCPSVDLWAFYLTFVKGLHPILNKYKKGEVPTFEIGEYDLARDEVIKAYDLAVEVIGKDIYSSQIWIDFIRFLRGEKGTNDYDQGQLVSKIRSVYQKAVVTPMQNLDTIWKEYEQWEAGLDKTLADAMMKQIGPNFKRALAVFKERLPLWQQLAPEGMLAHPPRGTEDERQQMKRWAAVFAYEKKNPLGLQFKPRKEYINFVYEKYLCQFYFFPQAWHEAALWRAECRSSNVIGQGAGGGSNVAIAEEMLKVLKRGIEANPSSVLLRLAAADLLENNKMLKEARTMYEEAVADCSSPLCALQFLRFVRRTESAKAARKEMTNLLKSGNASVVSWELYVGYSHLEFYLNGEKDRAKGIFDIGMKKFSTVPQFVLEYASFLEKLNDDRNVRSLFLRVIDDTLAQKQEEEKKSITADPQESTVRTLKLYYDHFIAFEQRRGDLVACLKAEMRRQEAFPEEEEFKTDALLNVANRYKFLNMWPCSDFERSLMGGSVPSPSTPRMSGGVQSTVAAPSHASLLNPHARAVPLQTPSLPGSSGMSSSSAGGQSIPASTSSAAMSVDAPLRKDATALKGATIVKGPQPNANQSAPAQALPLGRAPPVAVPPSDAHLGRVPQEVPFRLMPDLPPLLKAFAVSLPPPAMYRGPKVNVDELVHILRIARIDRSYILSADNEIRRDDGRDTYKRRREDDLPPYDYVPPTGADTFKRRREDDTPPFASPPADVYGRRQMQRGPG
mmetsp:Transcript_39400/g.100993  ORF Transcript_39400/g.100993 Transcript_39400/m.100993 type:complete len:922 (-) Transcript_39400:596-3361(-)